MAQVDEVSAMKKFLDTQILGANASATGRSLDEKFDGFVEYKGMKRRVSANLRTLFPTNNRGNRKRRLVFDF